MSRDDRDRPELDEDTPVTPAEQARAEAFGRWLDGIAAGEPLPPAMDSEDRALLETATMVSASSHAIELAPDRARRLIDQALENAMIGPRVVAAVRPGGRITALHHVGRAQSSEAAMHGEEDGDRSARSSTDLVLAPRRRFDRVLRHVPWAVASLAVAAAVILFVRDRALEGGQAHMERAPVVQPLRLGVANTSRPADPLVGVIARRDAGRASERLDIIFADRLDGYRDLMLRRALGKEQP